MCVGVFGLGSFHREVDVTKSEDIKSNWDCTGRYSGWKKGEKAVLVELFGKNAVVSQLVLN